MEIKVRSNKLKAFIDRKHDRILYMTPFYCRRYYNTFGLYVLTYLVNFIYALDAAWEKFPFVKLIQGHAGSK